MNLEEEKPYVVEKDGELMLNICIGEYEALLDEQSDLDYDIQQIYAEDEVDYEEASRLEERQKQVKNRIDELVAQGHEWYKGANAFEKLVVGVPLDDGFGNMGIEKRGMRLNELLESEEVKGNDDFMKKIKSFKEKCSDSVNDYMVITCDGIFKDGQLQCSSIEGAYSIINSDCRRASINFKTGEIMVYADSIRPDWVIDENYIDESIIDESLLTQVHDVAEISEIDGRKISDTNAVVAMVAEALKEEQKEVNGPTKED